MVEHSDYFSEEVVEIIVHAIHDAYDANILNFDPLIGNSSVSFGVAVWQSTLYFLEQAFAVVPSAQVSRMGSEFRIELPTCTLSFYKFGSSSVSNALDFRLNPKLSRARQRIIAGNQLSLFKYSTEPSEPKLLIRELVVIHSGNAYDGLLEVHVGAAISEKRSEKGWRWLSQLYVKPEIRRQASPVPPHISEYDLSGTAQIAAQSYEDVGEYDTPLTFRTKLDDDQLTEAIDRKKSS